MYLLGMIYTGADPGFDVRGTKFGKGSGDRLKSPAAGPGQSPGGGPEGETPLEAPGFWAFK